VKPVDAEHLVASVGRGLENSRDKSLLHAGREAAASLIDNLTPRQRQVMDLILAGLPNKNIALDLGISQRTVENHRAAIMKATGSKNLPALIRTVFAAEGESGDEEGDIG
jgi:two-component system CheB/CheR fusion protein